VGFGAGNGLGIARAFGAEGFRLALISRNPAKQAESARALNEAGVTFQSFAADAADPESIRKTLSSVDEALGPTDVLIYNAFSPRFGRPTAMTPADMSADFAVSVVGAFSATLAVLPSMKARKSGTILFTGGGWALYPSVDAASISLTKAALRNLAYTLSDDLRSSGIRVGTLTIMGVVAQGTPFDPSAIGRAFVAYYKRPDTDFPPEVPFKGTA
jgi:NAD(P)-dependent dehydrogenase (short-subunit alcohol dehydrogenase family)